MDKIAVFVNDAAYARHILEPMLKGDGPTHWVLVACAPGLTRHIGRWVSNTAREQWRARWAAEVFADLEPELRLNPGSTIEKMVAKKPLVDVSARLESRLGGLRLLDARRPRLGKSDEPLSRTQPPSAEVGRWAAVVAVTSGLSAMLAMSD